MKISFPCRPVQGIVWIIWPIPVKGIDGKTLRLVAFSRIFHTIDRCRFFHTGAVESLIPCLGQRGTYSKYPSGREPGN